MRTYTTTIRLSAIDKRNAKAIIQSGAAHNVSDAIRVALYEAAEKRGFQSRGAEYDGRMWAEQEKIAKAAERRRVSAQGQERTA